jgi:hypothetical protein
MTQRNQAVDARPKVKEKIESICGFGCEVADIDVATGEFGNRMSKHRRLSDRRVTFTLPEVTVMVRGKLVIDMRNESFGVLRSEEVRKFAPRPIRLAEVGPGDGVETGVP